MKGRSLATKILLMVVPLLIASVAGTAVLFVLAFNSSFEDEMADRARLLSELGASTLANPVYSLDISQVVVATVGFKSMPDVAEVLVYDPEGNILSDGTEENALMYSAFEGKRLEGEPLELLEIDRGFVRATRAIELGSQRLGSIRVSLSTEVLRHKQVELSLIAAGVLAFVMVVGFFIVLAIRRTLSPLRKMIDSTAALADGGGDLSIRVPELSRDEIGVLAANFNRFLVTLSAIVADLRRSGAVLSDSASDLGSSLEENAASIRQMTASITTAADNAARQESASECSLKDAEGLLESLGEIGRLADAARSSAVSVSEGIAGVSERAAAASGVAAKADEATERLRRSAEDGVRSIEELVAAQKNLSSGSDRIKEMVGLIMGISSQTDLLAMNAAIEAAHAGDAGRGFAVVAEEIRKLADMSSSGAKEIEDAVKGIMSSIEDGIDLGRKSAEGLGEMMSDFATVKEISLRIRAALEDQGNANRLVLTSMSELRSLSDAMASKTQVELERGRQIRLSIADLRQLSSEIAQASSEESRAMQETNASIGLMRDVGSSVKETADRIEEQVRKFAL